MTAPTTQQETSTGDAWTVKRVMDWTVAHLQRKGSDSPRLDTEILLAHARGCERIELYTHFNDVLTDDERATMRELVQRRANHEPVAYLVGYREFYSLEFEVNKDVLIPRPDTETIVLELLEIAKTMASPKIVDVCTGSGCIAISVAVNHDTAEVVATELHDVALQIAVQNSEKHEVSDRIEFLKGDLLSCIKPEQQFDIVASNPPYVATADIETLEPTVREHEPHTALDGGADGTRYISRLITDAPNYLKDGGYLMLEMGSEQAGMVCELIDENGQFSDAQILTDLAGRSRVACARKKPA
ncbi:MAG: protein-(glutamine-N5) methyltransferase, release factor-specific [Planctomycetaceae bacterium]|nr:protein-(glutamine-N5) methyltransferase, release factor-specific [Planctomycetaceae bacterium]